ncbi:MAG TPA: LysR family transcriptional regulator [Vineibacter sp.]|nr:LysR family transcriptional regulator [Vineibacter sp.]
MDRFEAIAAFVAVVEADGFSAAARRLGQPLASVSRKVSALERALRVRLLNRTTRQVQPTDSGRQFFEACRRILAELDVAERAASGEYRAPRGELTITAPIVFGRLHVTPIVTAFLKTYPAIDVRLILADGVVDLLEARIDVAVRIGRLGDSGMLAIPIGDIGRIACASPAYLAANGTPEHPKALAAHSCVTFAGTRGLTQWSFRTGRKMRAFAVRARLTVTTAEAAIDAAIAGVGITQVLSYQATEAIRRGRLVRILRAHEPPVAPAHLVHASGRLVPLKLRAFLDFAAPRLRARLKDAT